MNISQSNSQTAIGGAGGSGGNGGNGYVGISPHINDLIFTSTTENFEDVEVCSTIY